MNLTILAAVAAASLSVAASAAEPSRPPAPEVGAATTKGDDAGAKRGGATPETSPGKPRKPRRSPAAEKKKAPPAAEKSKPCEEVKPCAIE